MDSGNLIKRIKELENHVGSLEQRNFELTQEMLSSESKQRELQEANKKNGDSLKTSRNIITSLNDKITREKKEFEGIMREVKEGHQKEMQALKLTQNEVLKQSETMVFELNMKLIDQTH